MQPVSSLDRAGTRRSPATLANFHQGRAPHNKGLRYPPDPPTVEEIISVRRAAGDDVDGVRLRALIIILWRTGLRISEALALAETDLDLGTTDLRIGLEEEPVREPDPTSPLRSHHGRRRRAESNRAGTLGAFHRSERDGAARSVRPVASGLL